MSLLLLFQIDRQDFGEADAYHTRPFGRTSVAGACPKQKTCLWVITCHHPL
jgi:hypothetical protein